MGEQSTQRERIDDVVEQLQEKEAGEHEQFNFRESIKLIEGKQRDIQQEVIGHILTGDNIDADDITALRIKNEEVRETKAKLLAEFNKAEIGESTDSPHVELVLAKRLGVLVRNEESRRAIAAQRLSESSQTYCIGDTQSPLLSEAVSVMDGSNIMGFTLQQEQESSDSFAVELITQEGDRTLKKKIVKVSLSDRQEAAVIFAPEGDIAGHAKRAGEVAKAMVKLGYGGDIHWVASGKYAEVDSDVRNNIHHIQLHTESPGEANDAIISALEGKGNMQIWDSNKVAARNAEYKTAFGKVISEIGNKPAVLVSDFAPIADITWKELQQQHAREGDIVLSETHDTTMPATRMLRTFRLFGSPVGEIAYRLNTSELARKLDPQGMMYQVVNRNLNAAVDSYLGKPLHALRQTTKVESNRSPSFRGEMKASDGSLSFGIERTGGWNVGLLAEGAKGNEASELTDRIRELSAGKRLVYHNEGSTYDQAAFFHTAAILASLSDVYTVNAIGTKQDIPFLAEKGIKIGAENDRYMVMGYAPGYDIVRHTNTKLAINQAGWGTFSQAMHAEVDHMRVAIDEIMEAVDTEDNEAVNQRIHENEGSLRWISIPKTWEQENNARLLQERGAFCEVVLPSDLQTVQRRQEFRVIIQRALNEPISEKERDFWTQVYMDTAQSSPALHAALIIERQAMHG